MAFLNDDIRNEIGPILNELKETVTLVFFTQKTECRFCKETRELLEEITSLSPKLALEVLDFQRDAKKAEEYGVDKIPATVVLSPDYRGMRFFGIPSGYEFTSLLEAIRVASTSDSGLSADTRAFLDGLEENLHLQVFVTPTCPYCPGAVTLAHRMAHYSSRVTADMVEATEFPHLSQKYNVMGVPRTVINENAFQEGAAPEETLVQKIRSALGS